MHRRDFLKYTGLAGGTLALGGAAAAGYMSGADKTGNTDWGRAPYAKDQFFNRKPFFVKSPTYEKVGTPQRIQYLDNLFRRNGELGMYIRSLGEGGLKKAKEEGIESLPEELRQYYTEQTEAFDEFFLTRESAQQQRENWPEYRNKYLLGNPRAFRPSWHHKLKYLQWGLTIVALTMALAFQSPAISDYTIFDNFFRVGGPPLLVTVTIITLLISLVVSRPWCHFLCPLDGIFRWLKLINKNAQLLWKSRTKYTGKISQYLSL